MTNSNYLTASKKSQLQATNNKTSLHLEETIKKLKKINSLVNVLLVLIAILVVSGIFIQIMMYSL